jgi:hypothetical protein
MFNDKQFFEQAVRASRLAYDLGKPYLAKGTYPNKPRKQSRKYTQQQINDLWFIRDLSDITHTRYPDCQAPECHNPKHLKNLCRRHYDITRHFKAVY